MAGKREAISRPASPAVYSCRSAARAGGLWCHVARGDAMKIASGSANPVQGKLLTRCGSHLSLDHVDSVVGEQWATPSPCVGLAAATALPKRLLQGGAL